VSNRALNVAAASGILFALAACSTTDRANGGDVIAQGTAQAPVGAQVAVFNALFRSNASAIKDRAVSYCISTGPDGAAKTVDPAVLAALRDNPKVRPASACTIQANGSRVVDKATGKPSLMFSVDTVSCTSADDCLIHGGYHEGNLSAQTNRYRAQRVQGDWRILIEEIGPVS
jgi:hypothetical protein